MSNQWQTAFIELIDGPLFEPWDCPTVRRPRPRQNHESGDFFGGAKPRQRRPSLARLIAKAKQLGLDMTVDPGGAVTFHAGVSTTAESTINEWNEVLPRHGKH
jgi:hypothetical protein